MFLASTLSLVAVVAASSRAPDPGTEVKPVQLEIDAPEGCANADQFFSSLRFRTNQVRQATGDEPRTTLQVRLSEMHGYVLGELRIVDDRGGTDTRRVQGAKCDDVVQALSLAAAVALDPGFLFSAPSTVAAPETPGPESPPPPIAQATSESVGSQPMTDSPSSRASERASRFEFGTASVASALLSSGLSPGLAFFGRWTLAGGGAFRPTVGMAITYFRNDVFQSPGVAHASLAGLGATMCPLGWSASIMTVKPCGLVMAGVLAASGHRVARTSSVHLFWLSAGGILRAAVFLGRGLSLDLEAGISAPFIKRKFYTTKPGNVVEETPAISPIFGLGLAYGF